MAIERVDPRGLDCATARQVADLTNAAQRVDAPHLAPVSGEHARVRLRFGWDDLGSHHLLLARTDAGDLAGLAQIEFQRWDNPHLAGVDLETHPSYRGGTVDDELLSETVSIVRDARRTLLLGDAWRDSYRAKFWQERGFEVGSAAAQRRLYPPTLDWPRLDQLMADAERASATYDIIELPPPAPADLMPHLVHLQRAMNDAPLDELDIDDDIWSVERLRGYEQAMEHRGIALHRLVARRRSDGEFGGHTVVAVERERPQLGFQEDTGVIGAHRGHRLGLRMKIEMLRLLARREPQITHIDTWNAESNAHMIAVNDAIGCVVIGRGVEVQKRLDSV